MAEETLVSGRPPKQQYGADVSIVRDDVGIATQAKQDTTNTKLDTINTTLCSVQGWITDGLSQYKITDIDADASPNYYSFVDKAGNWYILKETISAGADTYRYAKGTSDYSTNWTGRAGLSYDYFNTTF